MNQILESQQTTHTSPSRVSYEVSIVRIIEKIDCVITAPYCTYLLTLKSETFGELDGLVTGVPGYQLHPVNGACNGSCDMYSGEASRSSSLLTAQITGGMITGEIDWLGAACWRQVRLSCGGDVLRWVSGNWRLPGKETSYTSLSQVSFCVCPNQWEMTLQCLSVNLSITFTEWTIHQGGTGYVTETQVYSWCQLCHHCHHQSDNSAAASDAKVGIMTNFLWCNFQDQLTFTQIILVSLPLICWASSTYVCQIIYQIDFILGRNISYMSPVDQSTLRSHLAESRLDSIWKNDF